MGKRWGKKKTKKKAQQYLESMGASRNDISKYARTNMNSESDFRQFVETYQQMNQPAPEPEPEPLPPPSPPPVVEPEVVIEEPEFDWEAEKAQMEADRVAREQQRAREQAARDADRERRFADLLKASIPKPYVPPKPPPPPPRMTTAGAADIGADSSALGVKGAGASKSSLNIGSTNMGSTGDVFGRRSKRRARQRELSIKRPDNLLPTSGITL